MISPLEKTHILSVLGKHYSREIIAHFERIGFKPQRSPSFTKTIIQSTVNGHFENQTLEIKILEFVNARKKEKKEIAKHRRALLAE